MVDEDFLTVPEAAAELAITVSSVHIALKENRLPYIEKYGRKLVSRADLDIYKLRTRPGGEKPKGRPLGMKNRL